MDFRTQVPIQPGAEKIDHHSRLLLLGSCFVQNIGEKLDYFKFEHLLNPVGILFHPRPIFDFLLAVQTGRRFSKEDIFEHNGIWHSFAAHSALSSLTPEGILERLNTAVTETRKFLLSASHVIITPGTAWAYRYKDSGEIVANCHKLSQRYFEKQLLEVTQDLAGCARIIQALNPKASVLFTVSPVRHLKDGFVENQRSKAALITAVHRVLTEVPNTAYFPAYEILMDELRDYRFYTEDMIHPNTTAIQYIWDKFQQAWMDPETRRIMERIDKIQKGLSHRPFNAGSQAHKDFLNSLEKQKNALLADYPYIKF